MLKGPRPWIHPCLSPYLFIIVADVLRRLLQHSALASYINTLLFLRENFVFGPKNNAPFLFDIETENLSYMS